MMLRLHMFIVMALVTTVLQWLFNMVIQHQWYALALALVVVAFSVAWDIRTMKKRAHGPYIEVTLKTLRDYALFGQAIKETGATIVMPLSDGRMLINTHGRQQVFFRLLPSRAKLYSLER